MKTISPNDYGKITIEQCQTLDINPIVKKLREDAHHSISKAEINVDGLKLKLTTSRTRSGTRYWFQCPQCSRRVGKLYKHPINKALGCRMCLDLDYKSHRYKGMLEQNLLKC